MTESISPRYTLISPWFDGVFFWSALPIVLIVTLFLERFAPDLIHPGYYPIWLFLLVLLVDVSHVWGSLFRVWSAPSLSLAYRLIVCGIPVLSFFVLLVLAHLSRDDGFFLMFQVLALIAAYHFVKQQIGVTLLYARRDVSHSPLFASKLKTLDKMIVWIATGVPLAYWISHSKELDLIWFVEGEFDVLSPLFQKLDLFILLSILAVFVYIFAQFYAIRIGGYRPNPLKYLYIMMTAFIWGWGIVVYESFVVFGFGVMLLHGLAYHGLVLSSVERSHRQKPLYRRTIYVIAIAFLTLLLAFFEEYLWDQLVWREWSRVFGESGYHLGVSGILPLIVALLGSIQLSHYLLDRYIWRKDFGEVIER